MTNDITIYLGIDPGLSGAIAFLSAEGFSRVFDPPTIIVPAAGKRRRHFMEYEIADLVRSEICGKRALAFIEWAQPMPKQGVTSVFSYGQGFGMWLGILAAFAVPTTKVRPQRWKAAMLAGQGGTDKNTAFKVASELFPDVDLGRRKDMGRAEALLIAEFGRRTAGGDR